MLHFNVEINMAFYEIYFETPLAKHYRCRSHMFLFYNICSQSMLSQEENCRCMYERVVLWCRKICGVVHRTDGEVDD